LDRQKPARKSYIWLNGERAEIAVGETTKIAEDSARTVQKAEIKKAYKFGGEQVLFTEAEKKELKNFGLPVLRIVGFKPQSTLPAWASVSKSTFIYPSEEDYVGSTRVFAALWQKLDKDKKMGLAWYIPRLNANPLLVALLPSQEQLDGYTKQQVIPAGLWAYPLPYSDDIRYPPEMLPPVVSPDSLIDRMRVVVQQLQLPGARFDPAKYPNPSLQWHYRILQAMALEEEIPEFKVSDDKTIPKYRQIDKRAGHYVAQWGVALEDEYRTWTKDKKSHPGGVGVKRGADEEKGTTSKKARSHAGSTKSSSSETLNGMSTNQLKKHIKAGKLGTATVAELKEWLSSNGLETSGRKAELMERIEQCFESK
jgi:ATP-dependent DNA helicase 2 subunit 1